MHTFYKVLQKNTLRKKICVFLCALCTASLVVLSNANAAEYICETKVYVSCKETYYLSDCGEEGNFKPTGGDSDLCISCPDKHSCAGGTACPVRTTLDVTCVAGQYIQKNATTCSSCPAGSFCKGGTYTIAAGGATEAVGATACAKGSYSEGGTSTCTACDGGKTTSGTGQTSCQACSNNANVATWVATSWSSDNTVSNLCTVDTCSAGSFKGNNQCTQCEAGTYSSGGAATSCTDCAAGTYQGEKGQSSCNDCTGRTKYSGKKATECSTVDEKNGYYTTGCDGSGNKCTGQAQCTGAKYCSGGVQYNCPAQTDGWTRGTANGWTKASDCNQIRNATSISSYCSAGQLKQTGKDSTSWNPISVSLEFEAKPGSYVSGTGANTTCKQCEKGYISIGGKITSCTACGTGKYQDETGQSSCKDCTAIANSTWQEHSGYTSNTCPFTCVGDYTPDPDNRQCNTCNRSQSCPKGYGDNTYDTCESETPEDNCKANCQPGTYVAVEYGACIPVPSTAKGYAAQHYVAYGAKSPTLSSCPGDATGNDEGASEVTQCYIDCPETKTINNGTTTFASGHVYYLSSSGNYDNDQCSYMVNCNARYGANSTDATKNPSCTWCENGYYSAGGNAQCTSCSNAPKTHATYTTNGTKNDDCGWQCNAGYYKSGTSCTSCPDGSTAVPVTSIAGANDTVQGCFISPLVNNNPTKITDSTGTFKYKSDATSYCYHN